MDQTEILEIIVAVNRELEAVVRYCAHTKLN